MQKVCSRDGSKAPTPEDREREAAQSKAKDDAVAETWLATGENVTDTQKVVATLTELEDGHVTEN